MSEKTKKSNFIGKLDLSSIIIGIIITFFLTKILEPLLEIIYSMFLNLGGNFIKAISDSTYQKISNGFCDQGAIFISYFLYLAVCFLAVWITTWAKTLMTDDLKTLSDLEKTASDYLNPPDDTDIFCTETNLTQKIEEISNNLIKSQKQHEDNCKKVIDSSPSLRKKYKQNYIKICLLVSILFFIFAFLYARMNFINTKITLTTNNIEIVSPHLDYKEYQQLKADFHSIKTKEDYDILQNKLHDLAQKNSINLKE